MSDFNKTYLMGNLVRDPEMKSLSGDNKVVNFTIALNRQWNGPEGQKAEEVSYIDCVAFGKKAETIDKYFSKGRKIFVEGRLKQDKWEDKTTHKMQSRIMTIVENFHFVDSKRDIAETIPEVAGNVSTKHGSHSEMTDEEFDAI